MQILYSGTRAASRRVPLLAEARRITQPTIPTSIFHDIWAVRVYPVAFIFYRFIPATIISLYSVGVKQCLDLAGNSGFIFCKSFGALLGFSCRLSAII